MKSAKIFKAMTATGWLYCCFLLPLAKNENHLPFFFLEERVSFLFYFSLVTSSGYKGNMTPFNFTGIAIYIELFYHYTVGELPRPRGKCSSIAFFSRCLFNTKMQFACILHSFSRFSFFAFFRGSSTRARCFVHYLRPISPPYMRYYKQDAHNIVIRISL